MKDGRDNEPGQDENGEFISVQPPCPRKQTSGPAGCPSSADSCQSDWACRSWCKSSKYPTLAAGVLSLIVRRADPYGGARNEIAMMQSVRDQFQLDAVSSAGPIAPSDRIAAIDIVRGIALFGVMAINVATIFRVSIFERFLPDGGDGTWLDRALYSILMVGIDLKAFALFSLLFGVGLAIQYDHLSADSRRTALLVRRLAFLMLIGAAHLVLIWNGDILFEYAIAGFVVLPFLFCRLRVLTLVGTALLALFLVASFLPEIAPMPSRAWMWQNVAEAMRIYGSGGFAEVLAFRVHELPGFLPLHVFMFPRTVALMLIGAATWRADLFRTGSRASQSLPLVAAVGFLAGGVLAVSQANGWLQLGWREELSLERLSTVLLACGYGATIVWATNRATGSETADVGCANRTNGVHQLPHAIRDLRLGVLWVWARPVWQAWCDRRSCHRHRRLHFADRLQRLLVAAFSLWPGGMAMAERDVWNTTAPMA